MRRLLLRIAIATSLLALLAAPAAGSDYVRRIDARSGGRLDVNLDAGTLEVETHDEPEVRVEAHGSGFGRLELELSGDGTDTRLDGKAKGFLGVFGANVRIRIRVPRRYSVDLRTGGGSIDVEELGGTVSARTSGGHIALDEVAGDVDVRTSGGSIEADEIGGDVKARTSGGRISVSEVWGAVEARTSGGSLELLDVGGPVEARTSGGGVVVRFTRAPAGHIETSGGPIEIEFARDAAVDLEARTSGGRVEVEHSIQLRGKLDPHHIVGEINGGGAKLTLRTSGGNILVKER